MTNEQILDSTRKVNTDKIIGVDHLIRYNLTLESLIEKGVVGNYRRGKAKEGNLNSKVESEICERALIQKCTKWQ